MKSILVMLLMISVSIICVAAEREETMCTAYMQCVNIDVTIPKKKEVHKNKKNKK